jgi:hypothetical protein
LQWIRADAERQAVPLQLAEAPPAGKTFVEIQVGDHPWFGIVPQPGSEYAEIGAHVVLVVCGPACAAALQQRLSDDAARARGETRPRPEPGARERAEAERLLRRTCAWCLMPVKRNAPVMAVYATLKAGPGERHHGGGIISIMIGERLVPGTLVEAGSEAALQGGDIAFLLCSGSCARQLSTAITAEASMSVVH